MVAESTVSLTSPSPFLFRWRTELPLQLLLFSSYSLYFYFNPHCCVESLLISRPNSLSLGRGVFSQVFLSRASRLPNTSSVPLEILLPLSRPDISRREWRFPSLQPHSSIPTLSDRVSEVFHFSFSLRIVGQGRPFCRLMFPGKSFLVSFGMTYQRERTLTLPFPAL